MSIFTEEHRKILDTTHIYIDEQLEDERKGVAMSYPIMTLSGKETYWCDKAGEMKLLPAELIGDYMIESTMDLRYYGQWKDLRNDNWVRAKYVPVTEYRYIPA